jgi:UDP-2,3-diacylglucosamine hydrolase
MAKSFFFSDAHLGTRKSKSERERQNKVLEFLDHVASEGKELFIVGDLFDFWFEYRSVIPRGYSHILTALIRLRTIGIEIHYIAGNHDFWMRDFLTTELDIPIHFDFLDYFLNGKRFFIQHGDGISKKDVGYRMLKKIFRNKFNIFLYSLLHPDIGIPLAKAISSISRQHSGHKENPPEDSDYLDTATKRFSEGYDCVILGHLHQPYIKKMGGKTYVNLGDWITHFTYAVFDGEELQLLKWE